MCKQGFSFSTNDFQILHSSVQYQNICQNKTFVVIYISQISRLANRCWCVPLSIRYPNNIFWSMNRCINATINGDTTGNILYCTMHHLYLHSVRNTWYSLLTSPWAGTALFVQARLCWVKLSGSWFSKNYKWGIYLCAPGVEVEKLLEWDIIMFKGGSQSNMVLIETAWL